MSRVAFSVAIRPWLDAIIRADTQCRAIAMAHHADEQPRQRNQSPRITLKCTHGNCRSVNASAGAAAMGANGS